MRLGDWETGRLGDGELGRVGEWEMGGDEKLTIHQITIRQSTEPK